jgi:hypothetical protein
MNLFVKIPVMDVENPFRALNIISLSKFSLELGTMSNAVRTALRSEIELTREKFHRFLVTIPDDTLRLPSKDPAWTNGELLYQMSTSPRIIKSFLKILRRENTRFHYVSKAITGPMIQKTNEIFIRSRGHQITRWLIAEEYDNTSALVLELLDAVCDDDFEKKLTLPDLDPLLSGQVTVESIFHYVKNHFYAYRNQIHVVRKLSES